MLITMKMMKRNGKIKMMKNTMLMMIRKLTINKLKINRISRRNKVIKINKI